MSDRTNDIMAIVEMMGESDNFTLVEAITVYEYLRHGTPVATPPAITRLPRVRIHGRRVSHKAWEVLGAMATTPHEFLTVADITSRIPDGHSSTVRSALKKNLVNGSRPYVDVRRTSTSRFTYRITNEGLRALAEMRGEVKSA